MKYLIILFCFTLAFNTFAQQTESSILSRTSEIPQSLLVPTNYNFTFIKDSVNTVYAVAHGYYDTKLNCTNCTAKKSGAGLGFEVYTPKSGECQIEVLGVGKTNNEIQLGIYNFKVVDSIYQVVMLDETKSGEVIYSVPSEISCTNRDYYNYNEEIKILKWTISGSGMTVEGEGSKFSNPAKNMFKSLRPNAVLLIELELESNFQGKRKAKGVFIKG